MEKKIDRPVGVSKELITFRRVTLEPTPEQLQAGAEAHDENGLPVGNYVGNYALLKEYTER